MRYGKILSIPLVLVLCLAWATPAAEAGCLKCRVKGFVKAHMDRNVDGVLSYVTDDFVMHRTESGLSLDRSAFAGMLEWEFATGTKVMYEDLVWDGQTVTAVFRESNDYYPLIGMKGRKYNMTFRFEGDDIRELTVEPAPCGCPDPRKRMAKFLEWAGKHHPEDISRIYRDGRFSYDGESARTWMALIRKWHGRG
jgi:hypothetical protein